MRLARVGGARDRAVLRRALATAALPVVLASRSPQRRQILARLGLDFSVRVPAVPELESGAPESVALENAMRKARAARRPGEAEIVIGCDTIVAVGGRIYGKPADEAEAAATIRALAGRTQRVISGLAVLVAAQPGADPAEERTALATTEVTFGPVDEELVAWYVGTGEWRERSGGYAIQGAGARLVTAVEGEIENVVGLPLAPLLELCPELARSR